MCAKWSLVPDDQRPEEFPLMRAASQTPERSISIHGGVIRVFRRKADGFRRVEVEMYEISLVTFYVSDEELRDVHAGFDPEFVPKEGHDLTYFSGGKVL